MKTILIGSFPTHLHIYEHLKRNNQLQAVCTQKHIVNNPNEEQWLQSIKKNTNTFTVDKNNLENEFKNWLKNQSPDLVLVCGFSLKVPESLLHIPTHGFLNIHFGKLPENRGANPIFWAVKKGIKNTAITIHQMDKNWDTGNILLEQSVPIIPGETAGMVNSKMSYILKQLTPQIINQIKTTKNYTPQQLKGTPNYNKRPDSEEISINWEKQTADEIENLVNACNPKHGGATTYYQGAPIKIIEVSPVNTQTPLFGKKLGEIIHAHPQEGLFVNCKYGQLIKINIINSDAGILTGTKYINLGIRLGHSFTTNQNTKLTYNQTTPN